MTLEEIINRAIKTEERGKAFYISLASRTQDDEIRQMFLNLSQEEDYHARAFKKIGSGLAGKELIIQENAEYLNAIMQDEVFPAEDNPPFEGGVAEALAIGIQAEKDSILLYQQLYETVQSEDAKQVISKLLKAEKMHLVELRHLAEDL